MIGKLFFVFFFLNFIYLLLSLEEYQFYLRAKQGINWVFFVFSCNFLLKKGSFEVEIFNLKMQVIILLSQDPFAVSKSSQVLLPKLNEVLRGSEFF